MKQEYTKINTVCGSSEETSLMDQQELQRSDRSQWSHRMDKNDPAINEGGRRNLHERREGDILGADRGEARYIPLSWIWRTCRSEDLQITDMQMVRFAFYFRQGHFLFPPWEIYRHLHIRKARWNKQYHCEILMTFSDFWGKSWSHFQGRNHSLHVSHSFYWTYMKHEFTVSLAIKQV